MAGNTDNNRKGEGMPLSHFTEQQFLAAVGNAAKGAAALIIAIGVVWAALWWALKPRIDDYFDSRLAEFRTEMSSLSTQLTRIENALPDPRPFIEFKSGGHLPQTRNFKPGETVTFLYQLRRNRSCPSEVQANFWSYDLNSIASEYTYRFSAIQATPSLDFGLFSVRVRIPGDMKPGDYSYAPIIIPDADACPSDTPVQVPPSEFFTVEAER